MKSILFLSHSASLTGAPILLHDIASRLDRNTYRLNFILGEDGPLAERFRKLGTTSIDPIYPDEVRYWREIKRFSGRMRLLSSIKPDLVFCNTIHPAKWLLYSRMRGIPTITHILELSQGFATLSVLEHQMIKRCSGRFIAASGAVKKYLVDHQEIHAETIQVVHAGVEIGRFDGNESVGEIKKRLGLENCFVIGTVGRITHVKGSDLFVKLASNLKRRHSGSVKLKFLVVATTADKEFFKIFTALLHQHELEQDVVIVKDVPDTSAYFSAMDIYVSTAREDPFPVVILEAMAARKPVVGFAVGGIPEAVTSESGILIEGDDVEIMTKEVAGLIHDSDRRLRLGLAGRKRVEEYFTLTRYAAEMTTLIEKAIR